MGFIPCPTFSFFYPLLFFVASTDELNDNFEHGKQSAQTLGVLNSAQESSGDEFLNPLSIDNMIKHFAVQDRLITDWLARIVVTQCYPLLWGLDGAAFHIAHCLCNHVGYESKGR